MFDTWTCHVCGKERPDAAISVYSTTKYIGTIPMQQNVRYCNDNPACIDGAKDVDFMEDVDETDEQVGDGKPEFVTRFRWRADRRCLKLNKRRQVNWYRYEVHRVHDQRGRWRWAVIAMQNKARPV